MKLWIAVAVGGAIGSLLRYLVQKNFNLSFPIGTLAVNLAGCFLAGALWAWYIKGVNAPVYIFLMTGFCGGFTTFSAFSVETVQMMLAGKWITFALYLFGSITGGLLATFIGFKLFSS